MADFPEWKMSRDAWLQCDGEGAYLRWSAIQALEVEEDDGRWTVAARLGNWVRVPVQSFATEEEAKRAVRSQMGRLSGHHE